MAPLLWLRCFHDAALDPHRLTSERNDRQLGNLRVDYLSGGRLSPLGGNLDANKVPWAVATSSFGRRKIVRLSPTADERQGRAYRPAVCVPAYVSKLDLEVS